MISLDTLRREPYRVLFPLGAIAGCVGVGHWLAFALGWNASYSGFYHASMQSGTFVMCFVTGFLLTAFPRFSSTPPVSTGELVAVVGCLALHVTLLSAGLWVPAEGALGAALVALASVIGRRVLAKRGSVTPPTEFVWIPLALLHGLTGIGLLIVGQMGWVPSWALGVGRPMLQQGLLLGIVLGVGGFMAPRLMGHQGLSAVPVGAVAVAGRGSPLTGIPKDDTSRGHDTTRSSSLLRSSEGAKESSSAAVDQIHRMRMRRVRWHGIAGTLLFASFWVEGAGAIGPAYLLRAAVVTAELAWTTRFYRPPVIPDGYVKLVWAALWSIIVGLWVVGVLPAYRVAGLHLVFLSGVSLMMFAVGTMVVLSHAGEAHRLRRSLWIVWVIGIGHAAALLARIVAEALPDAFFVALGVSSACWLIVGVSWLGFAIPRVVRTPDEETFERAHEETKRLVLERSSGTTSCSEASGRCEPPRSF